MEEINRSLFVLSYPSTNQLIDLLIVFYIHVFNNMTSPKTNFILFGIKADFITSD